MSDPWFPPIPPITPKDRSSPIVPTHDQLSVLYVIVVYAVVLFGLWTIPGIRLMIIPLKLFAIGWHELCHAILAIMTGGTITRISIDPSTGGRTTVQDGHPPSILCAGYVGSTLMGGLFILGGFDSLAAKLLSFVAGVGLIAPLSLVRDKLTILLTVFYEGLLIGFWFIDHAQALRYYMLFIGMIHILYVIWDITDEKFFRKPHDSDCTQFSYLYKAVPAHVWAMFWIVFQLGSLIGFIFIGIAAFKLTPDQMNVEASRFLPT
ncbi:peptidase M50B-like-domain-containing protein [Russula ochroleuca]|uniref:Peptidase M50B-like-domain-containing protein n=1 Tax=Russula ochroleuca TaxID=152965 RepID=A0A9P5JUB0_9AGAM|nr:peptidase M50B-like-domain-containing protein [Russula ochroleuca]